MGNYFLIHGAMGHSRENWFGWLSDKLKSEGKEVISFDYPTPEKQDFDIWSAVLNTVRDEIKKNSVFICHSIGAVFLVKYVLANKIKIGKLISVSGANNFETGMPEFDDINKTMFLEDVSKFKKYCKDRVCYYSKNDPYIKYDRLVHFADSIQADHRVIEGAGHFNQSAGYTKFEKLLKEL